MAFAIFTFKSILRRQKKKNYGKLKYLFHHAKISSSKPSPKKNNNNKKSIHYKKPKSFNIS
jgi:hypothetical protein